MRNVHKICFRWPALILVCCVTLRAADVTVKVDWPKFLSTSDMVWTRLPDNWNSGVFMGNGLLGTNVFLDETGKSLMWRVGRTDVTLNGSRIPIGELVLRTAGDLQGGNLRLDLWNAELDGTIRTTRGEIQIRSYTHAQQMVQVIEIQPDPGEASCQFEWHPGLAVDPRHIARKEPIPEDEKVPNPQLSEIDRIHFSTQPLLGGAEHVTAWTETNGKNNWRTLLLSVGYSGTQGEGGNQAVHAINTAVSTGLDSLTQSHRDWWHQYWPESFLSIPDNRLQAFYWIQMYKLASATRADRPAIDLMGPWFNKTPWPKIWWNLNIQLTYWPVLTSNRLELGESLCKMIDNGKSALAKNAGEFSGDSYAIGRSSSYDCVRPVAHEICDLPWALHNYYLQYRYSMDESMMRERLFPLLKGSINYYLHLLKSGPDGYLHITDGYSPEYPNQPTPNPDCNIDLSLLRWGCQTLLATCDRFKIDDPLIPKWKETLAKLVPYPTDENGLMISASVPFAVSHRHYSHLLMVYPLHIMNLDQPENRDLVVKSLDHWMGMPKALRGYSYTGAASISALLGRGDDSLKYLNELLDTKILPNTMYVEAGPVIETPLSAAASVHDMLLTSWGWKIRVFPGIPTSWSDVAFHNLRAEGAFLVSAVRDGGKTRFIRIESLAGEPCRLVTDMPNPSASGLSIRKLAEREYELELAKGQTVILTPDGAAANLDILPVTNGEGRENFYGLQ
jgi:alpha-L-fucosidase 2